VQVVDTSVCCLRLVPIDHVIFSDFHDSPDAEYVAQEVQVGQGFRSLGVGWGTVVGRGSTLRI
jgi:hypothetical protein